MIIHTKIIHDFGTYNAGKAEVVLNVHDAEHGRPSSTLSFNFGNASIIFHASESDLRALAIACDDAAIKIAALSQQANA